MAFTEDLLAFLDDDDFAVAATYNAATVYVIHEKQFLDQLNVQTSAPTALGRKSDFTSVAQEQSLVIGAVTWKIKEFHHDPPGFPDFTLLLLGTS